MAGTPKEMAKSKRYRFYESKDLVNKWDKLDREELKKCLAEWMRDMKAWGQDVRDDIIRLETAVGVAPGEPGDPPPAPKGGV